VSSRRRRKRCGSTGAPGFDNRREETASPSLKRPNPSHDRIIAAAVAQPSARKATIFVGDGGYGNILGTTGGATSTRDFEVYATAERRLDADDLNYLNEKGCFTLPKQSKELLEAYIKYVHPTSPLSKWQSSHKNTQTVSYRESIFYFFEACFRSVRATSRVCYGYQTGNCS
jgi:hypothetical protein